jgi:hypothetical protein
LKLLFVAVLGALIVLFALGTVLGVDMSPQNILEVLSNLAAELIKFLSRL